MSAAKLAEKISLSNELSWSMVLHCEETDWDVLEQLHNDDTGETTTNDASPSVPALLNDQSSAPSTGDTDDIRYSGAGHEERETESEGGREVGGIPKLGLPPIDKVSEVVDRFGPVPPTTAAFDRWANECGIDVRAVVAGGANAIKEAEQEAMVANDDTLLHGAQLVELHANAAMGSQWGIFERHKANVRLAAVVAEMSAIIEARAAVGALSLQRQQQAASQDAADEELGEQLADLSNPGASREATPRQETTATADTHEAAGGVNVTQSRPSSPSRVPVLSDEQLDGLLGIGVIDVSVAGDRSFV